MSKIDIRGFAASYDGRPVLHDLDVSFAANRITAIIGPSGCGKTTLLRSLNRTLELEGGAKTTGCIELDGADIASMPADALRRRVGMVFQTPSPFPQSIYKNMTYAPRYYGVRDKKELDRIVRENLEITGLYEEVKDDLGRSALRLSGGQQQRLCIARALTAGPEVLLLDEPCSALDVKSTQVIEELLTRLKEKYTIIIVTHNLFQARRISDDCLFLGGGDIHEFAHTRNLFETPTLPQTRDYLSGITA